MKTIQEVSKLVGLPISSLHYYEREKMVQPQRGENNYRYYSDNDVKRLKLIKVLRYYHFSIEESRCVLNNYIGFEEGKDTAQQAVAFFENKIADIRQIILGYETLLQLISHLPLMNDVLELAGKTKQTEDFINKLLEALI